MNNIYYIVETKRSKCFCCGKSIKNIYHYNGKDYGYYCFMSAIGKPIDKTVSKEKPLPNWIFDLMNEYIENEKDYFVKHYNSYDNKDSFIEDTVTNFIGKHVIYYSDHAVWSRAIKFQENLNYRILVYQQYMIHDYIIMRLKHYIED